MKNVCVVQARTNSNRLPGKVLLPLNGHTVIGEVLSRCWRIPGIHEVVCAIPTGDAALAKEALHYGPVTFGPEDNVLFRYYQAAVAHEADNIVRITGDCPLISPELCGAVLGRLLCSNADYASNVHPRTFPQGMDCEAFTFATLKRAEREALDDEREHVTTWMLRADIDRVNVASPWVMQGRLTLDTFDDYQTIRASFDSPSDQRLRVA